MSFTKAFPRRSIKPTGNTIRTRFLILSDTHACDVTAPKHYADVALHCGDLTQRSKLSEFRKSLALLQSINSPLKLVIPGNHDFTLDETLFRGREFKTRRLLSTKESEMEYGRTGDAIALMEEVREAGIFYLKEGTHQFKLGNGASLKLFASPYIPSLLEWGFRYEPSEGHKYEIEEGTDLVMTHCPPKGILDANYQGDEVGCRHLFEAVARIRPRLHCFGHSHEGWGAKLVTWRGDAASKRPSRMADVDEYHSVLVQDLDGLRRSSQDDEKVVEEKTEMARAAYNERCCRTSHCFDDDHPITFGRKTLFINAAVKGNKDDEHPMHLPWLVDAELPVANAD
ncbi:unnamed protein product [Clonostachys solani]|uniref:Calcineurin-like phosphoesterase domain-containing protein n=1 Tax=Clonostachys solani TaxID=160281 RepID=A0A9N9ZLK1_9HYPO|nr:unnamed protein product [Clonostachys solani]